MDEKDNDWVLVALHINELDFGDNHMAVVTIERKKICIGRYKDELFAFAYTCPHAGGIMADGYIDALGNVVCPLHRYKFCMKNGRNVTGEGYYLKHWPIKQTPDGIFVQYQPPTGWFR